MNKIAGVIDAIRTDGDISLVDVRTEAGVVGAIVLEAEGTAPYLHTGAKVFALAKETEVSLAVGEPGRLSLRNRIAGNVVTVQRGGVLSRVTLDTASGRLVSIITTRSLDALEIATGMQVTALIKATEVALMEDSGV